MDACGGGQGARGRTAVVSRGSRAPSVTFRTPPTRSAPVHAGSPPITTYHHCFVGGYVVGGWGVVVAGGAGAHRCGEPGVPDARGHAQGPRARGRTAVA